MEEELDSLLIEQLWMSLDKYQVERIKCESLIYDDFAAIVQQSRGGKTKWEREGMEEERDEQKRYVDQLKQEYDTKFGKLEELIEICRFENKSLIRNRLANKKSCVVKKCVTMKWILKQVLHLGQ